MLAQRIMRRVDIHPLPQVGTQRLLTAQSVRGLAYGIELEYDCPFITDTMIAEAIRCAALQLEDRYTGQKLADRLEHLTSC